MKYILEPAYVIQQLIDGVWESVAYYSEKTDIYNYINPDTNEVYASYRILEVQPNAKAIDGTKE